MAKTIARSARLSQHSEHNVRKSYYPKRNVSALSSQRNDGSDYAEMTSSRKLFQICSAAAEDVLLLTVARLTAMNHQL